MVGTVPSDTGDAARESPTRYTGAPDVRIGIPASALTLSGASGRIRCEA
jgi:hypothetical protein